MIIDLEEIQKSRIRQVLNQRLKFNFIRLYKNKHIQHNHSAFQIKQFLFLVPKLFISTIQLSKQEYLIEQRLLPSVAMTAFHFYPVLALMLFLMHDASIVISLFWQKFIASLAAFTRAYVHASFGSRAQTIYLIDPASFSLSEDDWLDAAAFQTVQVKLTLPQFSYLIEQSSQAQKEDLASDFSGISAITSHFQPLVLVNKQFFMHSVANVCPKNSHQLIESLTAFTRVSEHPRDGVNLKENFNSPKPKNWKERDATMNRIKINMVFIVYVFQYIIIQARNQLTSEIEL